MTLWPLWSWPFLGPQIRKCRHPALAPSLHLCTPAIGCDRALWHGPTLTPCEPSRLRESGSQDHEIREITMKRRIAQLVALVSCFPQKVA